ncbi:MAG: MFS transporter [Bilophila wadsworthia]
MLPACGNGDAGRRHLPEMMRRMQRKGLMDWFGTSDAREIERRIHGGDGKAALVYEAMAHNLAKNIGKLAVDTGPPRRHSAYGRRRPLPMLTDWGGRVLPRSGACAARRKRWNPALACCASCAVKKKRIPLRSGRSIAKTPSRLIILLAGLCRARSAAFCMRGRFSWSRWNRLLLAASRDVPDLHFHDHLLLARHVRRKAPVRARPCGADRRRVAVRRLLRASRIDSVIGLYLSYWVVSGFGIGIVNLVPAAVCLRWYPERKGLVSGLLTMALALGTLLFGTVGAGWLIGKVGVSSTFMALAVLFLGIIVLGSLFLRMPEAAPGKEEGDGVGLRDMLHTPSYWMIWGWMLTIQIGGLMIIGHIVPYALECGLTAAQAGLGMGVYAIANGVGRLFFGYVHDRFGRAWGMGLDAVFMGCGLVLLAVLPSRFGMAGFLIAAVPVALAFGGTIPQLAALIMAFFGPRHFGVNYGFSTSPLMVASVCGPFIGGLIRAWSGDYLVALYVAAAITLLGVAPAVVLREKAHKRESVAREGCPSPASLSSQNG